MSPITVYTKSACVQCNATFVSGQGRLRAGTTGGAAVLR